MTEQIKFDPDGVAWLEADIGGPRVRRTVEEVMRALVECIGEEDVPKARASRFVAKQLSLSIDAVAAAEAFARDSWCTPQHVADVLPPRERLLDPCSNPRSRVDAIVRYMLEKGENGLELTWCPMVPPLLVYANTGFSGIHPWVAKLAAERERIAGAAFMCNVDNSTTWWRGLTEILGGVFMFDKRLPFIPHPGVPKSTNNKPQALIGDRAFFDACKPGLWELGELYEKTRARSRRAA